MRADRRREHAEKERGRPNKEESKGKIKGETRKIKFRDDNFCVDSGSRFAEITDEIDLDVDQFIAAITDAIKAEQSKSGKTIEESIEEQEKEEALRLKEIVKAEEDKKKAKELETLVSEITEYIKNNKSNMDLIKPIIAKSKELGYDKPTEISDIKDAKAVLKLIS